jgi:hypothetical protein
LLWSASFAICAQSAVVDAGAVVGEDVFSVTFGFIFNNDFFEERTSLGSLLIAALFIGAVLWIVRLLIATWLLIEVCKVDLVTVLILVFEAFMKTATRSLLKQKLGEIAVGDEVAGFLADYILVDLTDFCVVREVKVFVLSIYAVVEVNACVLVLAVFALLRDAQVVLLLVGRAVSA